MSAAIFQTVFKGFSCCVKLCHTLGATVEGEIGHVGQADGADNDKLDLYTTVEEAQSYLANTGVDALAIAIGTAHGKYLKKPKLDMDRLRSIRAAVDTPLVLHGGSGLSDDDFRNCVKNGIAKVNIFTDICTAGEDAMRACMNENMFYLDARDKKVEAMKAVVKRKMELFGCVGHADD